MAAVEEDLVVEVSAVAVATAVVAEVTSAVAVDSAVVEWHSTVAFVAAVWLPDTLEAESGAAVVESALAERTFQVGLQTLVA